MKTTQMFLYRRISKQSVLYSYNGKLFTNKKNKLLEHTTWMNLKIIILKNKSLIQKITILL